MQTLSTRAIIFIGSNPSNASPSDCAFDPSVRSTKTLLTWISDIEAKFMFMNVSDIKTKNNKQLSMAEIKRSLPLLKEKLDAHPDAKLVALGRTAEKALKLLNRNDFLSLPHPSGINQIGRASCRERV